MIGRAVLGLAVAVSILQAAASPQKAMHAVEWTDPAGDVQPITTSGDDRPGFDVVKLGLVSDGTALAVNATLKGPMSGDWGSEVITLYVDTDNDPATGYKAFWSDAKGFDLKAELKACVETVDGGQACVGGFPDAKVKGYHAVVTLGRIIDTSGNTKAIVGAFDAQEVPIQGALVSAKVSYKDLGVKSSQTIRLMARETCGPFDASADFPVVLLTLK